MIALVPIALAAAVGSAPSSAAPDPAAAARAVVEAERAFARHAEALGTRDAFLAVLDPDGVLFGPGPVNGKELMSRRSVSPAVLAWEPEYVEVAASADFGYDTGPWTWRARGPRDTVSAAGHYVSVWRRDPGGDWRLLLDVGHSHPVARPGPLAVRLPRAAAGTAWHPRGAPARAGLLEADSALAARIAGVGYAEALLAALADSARVCRDERLPVIGRRAARALLPRAAAATSTTDAVEVAGSGDLGFTRGLSVRRAAPDAAPDSASFVRLWRRERDGWKVALDIEVPYPKR